MRFTIRAAAIISILLCGFSFNVNAQEFIVDKIGIEAIQRIQIVKSGGLDVLEVFVIIRNDNDKTLRFTKGKYEFYFGSKQRSNECLRPSCCPRLTTCSEHDELLKIGSQSGIDYDSICPKSNNILKFIITMESVDALKHIMNCIGDPCCKKPYLKIIGEFELGVKSDKGWTTGRDLGIEWIFQPQTQGEVLLR